MTITDDQLDAFAELANAIGLMRDGAPNTSWFTDPVGDSSDDEFSPGLATMLADDDQRSALVTFVDDVLGEPERSSDGDEIWVPLFNESKVTIHAVVTERPGTVWLGVGVEYETGSDAPFVATKVHVPIFQLRRRNGTLDVGDPSTPDWLLLGGVDGNVSIDLDATLSTDTPPPGDASLGGLAVSLTIPTSSAGTVAFSVALRRLQLPGASAPRDFTLSVDALDEIGADVLELVVGLLRAQADALDVTDPVVRPFAALTGLLGIRSVTDVPPLPLAELATRGVDTVVEWIGSVLDDDAARDAWLAELADLIGATVDAARDAVVFTIGPAAVSIGIRIDTGVQGLPILTPWVEVSLVTDAARGRVAVAADLLRLDTATAAVTALPTLGATAVFGSAAGAPAVLSGDPGIETIRLGVDRRDQSTVRAVVALEGVTLNGTEHDLVDLTSPNDALDVVNDVIDAALVDALAALGPAGDLVTKILGLAPPAGVDGTDATRLIADLVGSLAGYWNDLVADARAMVDVLGDVAQLLGANAGVTGLGTPDLPWAVALSGPVELQLFASAGTLCADLALTSTQPVLDAHHVVVTVRVGVACIHLDDPSLDLVTGATATLQLERTDGLAFRIGANDLFIEADHVAVSARWRPGRTIAVGLTAPGAVLQATGGFLPTVAVDLPLPTWGDDDRLEFEPDWRNVEDAVALLFAGLDLPIATALIELVGWHGEGARLDLGLLVSDPDLAIRRWVADLVLHCDRVEDVLLPISNLLNGLRGPRLLGAGSTHDPLRCPIGGSVSAPGLAVWTDPPCPPRPLPFGGSSGPALLDEQPVEPAELVESLRRAAETDPSIADLLVGRDGLADGIELLVERWTGTDGLVARPAAMPAGVTARDVAEASYDEMVAMGHRGELTFELFETPPSTVVHVGVEEIWAEAAERDAGTTVTLIDAASGSSSTASSRLAATAASGAEVYLVRLPTRSVAASVRDDRDATAEMTARLVDVFAERTDPCTVIAYGAAGAAAVRAAGTASAIDHVVTVGTPWSTLSVDSLATGLGGDALRLLALLARPADDDADAPADELSPERRSARVVDRAVASLVETGRPVSAASETIRNDLAVTAAFGHLSVDTIEAGLAGLVGRAIEARRTALLSATDPGPVTSLHAGVCVPPVDLDLGGLLIGAGITIEALRIERDETDAIAASLRRGVVVDLRLGVHDGWLVGGPGASQHDLEVRWLEARVHVPLDGDVGRTDLILHETTTFGVERERWQISGGDLLVQADQAGAVDSATSVVVPELRSLIGQVIARIESTAGDVADLFEAIGLTRDGGLDPDGLDRWIYDTSAAARDALATGATDVAAALRAIMADTSSTGTIVAWSDADTTLSIDLVTGELAGTATVTTEAVHAEISVALSPTTGSVSASIGVGDEQVGGIELNGGASTSDRPSLSFDVRHPGGSIETISLLDAVGTEALAGRLTELAAGLVGSGIGGRLVDHLRVAVDAAHQEAVDRALDLVGLLSEPSVQGARSARVPVGLFVDPVATFRHGIAAWRTSFAPSAVELLDLLGRLVDDTHAPGVWPFAPGCELRYVVDGDALRLDVSYDDDHTIGSAQVSTAVAVGVIVAPDESPTPAVDVTVSIDGHGARLGVDPALRLELVGPPPRRPLVLYPSGGSIADTLTTAGGMVAPLILNELIGHRNDPPPSALADVASAVHDIGEALDLVETDATTGDPRFSEARILAFAADPAAALLSRLPQLAATGLQTLADALDPATNLVVASTPSVGVTQLAFGAADGVTVLIDASGLTPAIEFRCDVTIPGGGVVAVDRLRLSTAGLQVAARFGPAEIAAGPVTLRPIVVVQAGVTDDGFDRLLGLGLSSDATGESSVEFRWGLDGTLPELTMIDRTGSPLGAVIDDPTGAALELLGFAVSLAGSVLVDALDDLLTDEVVGWLRGVVFETGTGDPVIDADLFTELVDPSALFDRLLTFAWNLATQSPPSLTIDDTVTIAVTSSGSGGNTRLGLNLDLVPDKPFPMASGDINADLVVDATWIDGDRPPGLTIDLLKGTKTSLAFAPAVTAAGIGVRVSKQAGALIDLGGVAIDAIAVHTYGEATSDGEVGGGVNLRFDGLAFAPAAGGGDNAVANSIMNDAGEAGAANRPSLSPSVSVQAPPGGDASVSVRLDEPPGPWWVIVQRQLGPLYIERVGLDTVESDGRVNRVSLLFDGRLSILGLTAAVDQLSLNWSGDDILSIDNWWVDLNGLAISAEMSGVFLTGGLLKHTEDGQVSYIGMLMGRFGVYGLSVFGGYSDDDGSPSFFVFGALNGPIGGPPAFFITGIGGGLGINRGLRTPDDLAQLDEYPFIKALDPGASASDDPMGELRDLAAYFPAERGNFWFAAGISFTSFALVDGVAVVAVAFGDGLDVNLFGLARMALPRPEVALVSIELAIMARFSTSEGLFIIQAQLTDNSWLLYPEVRLTGGFAMATWWKGALAGQFVLSLGGYHPDFHRDGYPVVPRLGLEWRVTDDIVIKGGSYFALTSEALMAGVDVEVSADWGWAWARVAFGAHAIVYFEPFYYRANAYARISAGVKINVLFGTVRISISIGASIEVEGPDFSGTAKFEVGPCDLKVSFGNRHKEAAPLLTWDAFTAKFLEVAPGGKARALSSITGRGTLPSATDGDTAAPTADGSAQLPFEVFAEHEIVFVTTVPSAAFTIGMASVPTDVTVNGTPSTLGAGPMGVDRLLSIVSIQLERKEGSSWVPVEVDIVAALRAGMEVVAEDVPTPSLRTDSFPLGVWGPTQDDADKPMPKGDVVTAGSVAKLVAGMFVEQVGPEIEYRQFDHGRRPLPFLATGDSRPQLLATSDGIDLVVPDSAREALAAAQVLVFADDASAHATDSGVQVRGAYSERARRSFVGDRSAPPQFGTLAGGIAAINGANATSTRMDPVAPAAPRSTRPPAVIGHLAAGAGAVRAASTTTVGDGRTKRRAAPSLQSVQGRMGNELPIRLDRRTVPAAELDGALVATSYPHTDLAGATVTTTGGRIGSPHLTQLVGGLPTGRGIGPLPLSDNDSSAIRSGDIVVMEQIDADIDVGDDRPVLRVEGSARVVMVRRGGSVAVDRSIRDTEVKVPPGVALVAAQADPAETAGALTGWHSRTRLARLGARTGVGPGCVVCADALRVRRRTGWVPAGEMVAASTATTTHFPGAASYVVIVLAGGRRVDLDTMAVVFDRCHRATDKHGREIAPTVVLSASQSMTFVPIQMDGLDDPTGFSVTVRRGGGHRLAGVLAGDGEVTAVAEVVAARGLDAVAGRLLAVEGSGCRLHWSHPEPPRPRRRAATKKRSAATKATTKKQAAERATSKKRAAKRATERKER